MPAPAVHFEPTEYSTDELRFLLLNLDKPPVVVRDMSLPSGVVRAQVLKLVGQCYELQEKFQHQGVPWAGYQKVQESIERTLLWYQTCAELKRRGGPAHPSMHTWDGPRYLPRGPESDSQVVRTEILRDGSRRQLGLNLVSPDGIGVGPNLIGAAPWLDEDHVSPDLLAATPSELIHEVNEAAHTGTLRCPICDWAQSYSTMKGNSKFAANSRMLRHCKTSKTQKDQHAILYGRLTGKARAV